MSEKPTVARARRALYAVLMFAAPLAINQQAAAAADWKPEKPVELIATNAPGGGSDRILRLMQKIVQDLPGVKVAINVVNKPGGGSSIAYNYVNQHPGDAHYFVMASKSLLTNNLVGRGPSYTTLTPVAHLFEEYVALTVPVNSPIKDAKEVIERLKKDPQAVSFGIATSIGAPNHQGIAVAAGKAGIDVKKLRAVIFTSGGKATTAMFGGHIDAVPISVAFSANLLRNGQARILAVAAPKRLPGDLAGVPTWRELGYDAVVSQWRGFVGPKGLTAAQLAYWEDTFRRLMETPEWKQELERNFWEANVQGSAGFRKILDEDNAELKAFLGSLDLIKK